MLGGCGLGGDIDPLAGVGGVDEAIVDIPRRFVIAGNPQKLDDARCACVDKCDGRDAGGPLRAIYILAAGDKACVAAHIEIGGAHRVWHIAIGPSGPAGHDAIRGILLAE